MDEHERSRDTGKTIGGALVILAVGAALGIGWNAMGLASLPVRGLPWIMHPPGTPSLESLQSPSGGVAPADTMVTPAPRLAPAPGPDTSMARVADVAPRRTTAPESAPANAKVAAPRRTAARDSAPALAAKQPAPATDVPSASAAQAPAPVAEPPVIPDVSGPLTVELPAFKRLYDAGAALVVDAREPGTYDQGHIAGAISLPYNDALADRGRVERLDPGSRAIVVYCSGGTCELSLDLAKFLVESGRRKVLVYEGGYHEWQVAGYPIERGPAAGARP